MTNGNTAATGKRIFLSLLDGLLFFLLAFLIFKPKLTPDPDNFYVLISWKLILGSSLFGVFYCLICYYFLSALPVTYLGGLKYVKSSNGSKISWVNIFAITFITGPLLAILGLVGTSIAFFNERRRTLYNWVSGTSVIQSTPRSNSPRKRHIIGVILLIFSLVGAVRNLFDIRQANIIRLEGIYMPGIRTSNLTAKESVDLQLYMAFVEQIKKMNIRISEISKSELKNSDDGKKLAQRLEVEVVPSLKNLLNESLEKSSRPSLFKELYVNIHDMLSIEIEFVLLTISDPSAKLKKDLLITNSRLLSNASSAWIRHQSSVFKVLGL